MVRSFIEKSSYVYKNDFFYKNLASELGFALILFEFFCKP